MIDDPTDPAAGDRERLTPPPIPQPVRLRELDPSLPPPPAATASTASATGVAATTPPPIPRLGSIAGLSSSPWLHVVLFLATLATTTLAGAFGAGENPFVSPPALLAGLPFSLTLLAILFSHEMGHWLLARHHRVPTSLPYFIPAPPFLVGTFGAFIRMRGTPRSRQALFDIGAAGPWAGFVVALPAIMLGLAWSEVRPLEASAALGLSFGNSILFAGLTQLILGVHPDDVTILLHPVALAGWFGLFVTFLNLLPVGQLDGGHVAYALFGRSHRWIARLFMGVLLVLGIQGWDGWFLWVFLLAFVIRVDHPDTADRETPLDRRRKLAAWLTVLLFVLTFMPEPLILMDEDQAAIAPGHEREAPRPQPQQAPDPANGLLAT